MAANPQSPTDSFLASAVRNLMMLNADLARTEDSGLSPSEVAFVPEAALRPYTPRGLPVAEIDAELTIPGCEALQVTVRVWGKFTPFRAGGHEPGERAYEPDDEAGFVVDTIMIGDTDVTGDLGDAGERAISEYVMENCEPEPCRDSCEDRR